jgi:hypothetical protein
MTGAAPGTPCPDCGKVGRRITAPVFGATLEPSATLNKGKRVAIGGSLSPTGALSVLQQRTAILRQKPEVRKATHVITAVIAVAVVLASHLFAFSFLIDAVFCGISWAISEFALPFILDKLGRGE